MVHSCCSMYQDFLPFFRLNNISWSIYTTLFLIHSSISEYLGSFHLLATVNSAVIYISEQLCSQVPAFDSFGCISKNKKVGFYGDSIFNFFRNHHTVFRIVYTILLSHQQFLFLHIRANTFSSFLCSPS